MDDAALAAIDRVLDGATCWGAELDTRYRVLGVTVEPAVGRHPDRDVDDRRLQLVLHPCSHVQARLVHDATTVEQFDVAQLVAVVDRLDGPEIEGPVVTDPGPPLTGELSLEGRAEVADGRAHAARIELAGADRELTLWVTFDTAELRRPDGSVVALDATA